MYVRLVLSALLLAYPATRVLAQEGCPEPVTVTADPVTVTVGPDGCICEGGGAPGGSEDAADPTPTPPDNDEGSSSDDEGAQPTPPPEEDDDPAVTPIPNGSGNEEGTPPTPVPGEDSDPSTTPPTESGPPEDSGAPPIDSGNTDPIEENNPEPTPSPDGEESVTPPGQDGGSTPTPGPEEENPEPTPGPEGEETPATDPPAEGTDPAPTPGPDEDNPEPTPDPQPSDTPNPEDDNNDEDNNDEDNNDEDNNDEDNNDEDNNDEDNNDEDNNDEDNDEDNNDDDGPDPGPGPPPDTEDPDNGGGGEDGPDPGPGPPPNNEDPDNGGGSEDGPDPGPGPPPDNEDPDNGSGGGDEPEPTTPPVDDNEDENDDQESDNGSEQTEPSATTPPADGETGSPEETAEPSETEEPSSSSDPCSPPTAIPGTDFLVKRQDDGAGDEEGGSCELGEEYIIYPEDGGDKSGTGAAFAHMSSMVVSDSIYTSDLEDYGVLFWRAILTPSQADELRDDPNVAVVYQPCGDDCYDPFTEIERQAEAEDDLVIIGQIENQDLSWYRSSYLFDTKAGEDVNLYILDSGADLEHAEFTFGQDIASKARYINASPDLDSDENDGHFNKHGTCMLARAAGHTLGVAKKVSPVIVRVPAALKVKGWDVEHYLEGLRKIYKDVRGWEFDMRKRDTAPLAVLSMSFYYPHFTDGGDPMFSQKVKKEDGTEEKVDVYDKVRSTMSLLLRMLVDKGVLPVAGTGNTGSTSMDGLPATLANERDPEYVRELLTVGASNAKGTEMWAGTNRDSDKGLPHVYAPGDKVRCPDVPLGDNEYRRTSGTSPATAEVAALAAYFISLAEKGPETGVDISSPQELKDYIIELAYPRGDDESVNVIYNGVRPSDAGGVDGPSCALAKRDDDLPHEICTPGDDPSGGGGSDGADDEDEDEGEDDDGSGAEPSGDDGPDDEGDDDEDPPDDNSDESDHDWECEVYQGSKNQNQCSCFPTDCSMEDDPECHSLVMFKNEDGCDSECSGCDPKGALEKRSPRRFSRFLF